jgi:hypothetical protein
MTAQDLLDRGPRRVTKPFFRHVLLFASIQLGQLARQPASLFALGEHIHGRLNGAAAVGIFALTHPTVQVLDCLPVEGARNFPRLYRNPGAVIARSVILVA